MFTVTGKAICKQTVLACLVLAACAVGCKQEAKLGAVSGKVGIDRHGLWSKLEVSVLLFGFLYP